MNIYQKLHYHEKLKKESAIKLCVDEAALSNNYKKLQKITKNTICASVLKANAYGLGCDKISNILYESGCRYFFVSHVFEGIQLRNNLGNNPKIYVLNPEFDSGIEDLINSNLIPVLNYIDQINSWKNICLLKNKKFPCVIHVDTGMNRSGISYYDFENILNDIEKLNIEIIMSHLAMSDISHEITLNQYDRFMNVSKYFPNSLKSLGSSNSVIKNNSDFFLDMVSRRYMVFMVLGMMVCKCVPSLWAKIYEVMELKKGDFSGYEATYVAKKHMKIATLLIGYADGIPLNLSNKGYVDICGHKAPIIGRISMDLMTIDITNIPNNHCQLRQLGGNFW